MVKKRIVALIFALPVLMGVVAGCHHASQCGLAGNKRDCNFSGNK
jgi:hypothetical protein